MPDDARSELKWLLALALLFGAYQAGWWHRGSIQPNYEFHTGTQPMIWRTDPVSGKAWWAAPGDNEFWHAIAGNESGYEVLVPSKRPDQ